MHWPWMLTEGPVSTLSLLNNSFGLQTYTGELWKLRKLLLRNESQLFHVTSDALEGALDIKALLNAQLDLVTG